MNTTPKITHMAMYSVTYRDGEKRGTTPGPLTSMSQVGCQQHPYAANLYAGLGQAMRALGRHREASIAFDYAVHVDRKFAQAWVDRGDELKALNRLEDAEEAYEEARKLGLARAE